MTTDGNAEKVKQCLSINEKLKQVFINMNLFNFIISTIMIYYFSSLLTMQVKNGYGNLFLKQLTGQCWRLLSEKKKIQIH